MTRQNQLKEIGEMIPQEFTSHFIIPFPHKFYDNKVNIFNDIEKLGWEILNKADGRQIGTFNIKKHIYDNTIPKLENKKKHLENNASLLLRKPIEKKAEIGKYSFTITDIDLWIFDAQIGFFVLKVNIDHTLYTINELSEFNKQFREFKFLKCKVIDKNLILEKAANHAEPNEVLDHLLGYTLIDNKSFLNTTKKDCIDSPIYNSSTNSKLMTAIQTKTTKFSNEDDIEPLHTSDLLFTTINGTSTLQEVPFYLASCSSLSPTSHFMNNEGYIHALVNNGGLNIWKYSSGITLHDSFALFGLEDDGGPVVSNMESSFYFIYILNLYINFQIRFIENELIDQDFDSLDITYRYKQLQKLKNQFISKEIGIKFQENEVHNSIFTALKTEDMISQVTENLMETKEITQSNLGMYITLLGFIFVSILQEPLTNIISNNPFKFIVGTLTVGVILFINRATIKKTYINIITKLSNL